MRISFPFNLGSANHCVCSNQWTNPTHSAHHLSLVSCLNCSAVECKFPQFPNCVTHLLHGSLKINYLWPDSWSTLWNLSAKAWNFSKFLITRFTVDHDHISWRFINSYIGRFEKLREPTKFVGPFVKWF